MGLSFSRFLYVFFSMHVIYFVVEAAQEDALDPDPAFELVFKARVEFRIPEVTALKGYLLRRPRMAFLVSHRHYLQLKSFLLRVDNFIYHDPTQCVYWNLDDHLVNVLTLVEKLFFMTILYHFGCIIPNIHVTTFMSHLIFFIILDSVTKDHVFY